MKLTDWPVVQAAKLSRSPEAFFVEQREALGDPFPLRLPGVGPLWVTGRPDGARAVFSAPPDTFEPLENNPVEPLLGSSSLILLGGSRHRRERKLLAPPFRGERMRAHGAAIRKIAREVARATRGPRPFAVQDLTREITVRVIIETVFGVQDPSRRALFERSIAALLEGYIAPLMIVPALRKRLGGVGPWDRFVSARKKFRALLREEIAARRVASTEDATDILALLLELRYDDGSRPDDEAIVDQLCTLLVAGHDTTAIGLTWALYFLHEGRHTLARLRSELEGGADPVSRTSAPYLAAVCNEALRMHPVVPIVVRRLTKPLTICARELSVGDAVAVALPLLHRDPKLFPDPEVFRPERFLAWQPAPHEFAPFGGGARRCLGAGFAAFEMRVTLAAVLEELELELVDERAPVPVLHGITMGPQTPIRFRVIPRRDVPVAAPRATL